MLSIHPTRTIAFAIGCMNLLVPHTAFAESGEDLAKAWCSSCHEYPAPDMLDRETWMEHVLPEMGARLGFSVFQGAEYGRNPTTPDSIYPSAPLLADTDWQKIIDWYEDTAPEYLTLPNWRSRAQLDLFDLEISDQSNSEFPTTTAIYIDERSRQIMLADSYGLNLETYDEKLERLDSIGSGGAVSRIMSAPSGGYFATNMGGNIGQSENLFGILLEIPNAANAVTGLNRIVRNLHRPVDLEWGDFNGDNKTDYLVAEFGTHSGKLSLHESQPDGNFARTVFLDAAGVTSVEIYDGTLYTLVAQGDERIVRFEGFMDNIEATPETILRFSPSQGSSSLHVLDFNNDGIADLLYTAGDNADISPIFKPYHGIYLFTGRDDGSFEQSMFFHFDGATNAVAEDFDQAGDLDIAAIAYYPQIGQGLDQSAFLYLQNTNGSFVPYFVEDVGSLGRYIAISAGDVDGDGDVDIALANMAFGPYGPLEVSPELQHRWLDGPTFILLRNKTH